jgi:Transcriptional regulator/sugar kinase
VSYLIGIDIGGTRIKAVAVTTEGEILGEQVLPTSDDGTPAWRESVALAVAALRFQLRSAPAAIGLAAPGLPSRDGFSIASMPGRLPGLEGFHWRELLEAPAPVSVVNDAQAALLAEVWLGAARGSENVLLLTLGTGVGGAVLADGRLLRGHLGRAGHLGHVSLDAFGALDIVNTPGSLELAVGECTVSLRSRGRFATTLELVAAVAAGDAFATGVWDRSIQSLAAAVAGFVNVLDPEIVVVGGGISAAGEALFPSLRKHLDRFEWRPGGAAVRLVPAQLRNRAGALGAARAAFLSLSKSL